MLKENEIHGDGTKGEEESKARKTSIPVNSLISMWEDRATTLKKNSIRANSDDTIGNVFDVIFFAVARQNYCNMKSC